MEYSLENNEAKIVIDTKACEITSFKRKDLNMEYMWQGDPKYWAGRNPTLFPHVSASKDKKLIFKGREYNVGNHGFARRSEFEFVKKTDNTLLFRLVDNENTYKEYPYHFELDIEYVLKGCEVSVNYTIINKDNEIMPFGFGLHPAFNCPFTNTKTFGEYWIEYNDGTKYQLNYQDFQEKGTLVTNNPKFNEAYLTDGNHGVKLHFDGYKMFAVWTPMAPFVCLEPWTSHLDNSKEYPVPFENIDDIIKLQPLEEFDISYRIEIK